MSISCIVSNLNGAKYLPRLLETLKGQKDVALEIIIVDRQSKDASHQILAQHPDVKVITEPPESGLVAGYAAAVPHAKYDYFFFSNEDMWFSPDCLSLVRRQFDVTGAGRVGAVMPVQLTYDGKGEVNKGTWFTGARWYRGNPYPFRASVFRDAKGPETISGINAGACMISRTAYDDVGGWDTSFFLDYEDFDLNVRLWQRGWTCRLEPRALVYHAVGASNAQTIHQGQSTVGRKRYIGALSNQVVIAMKTFAGAGSVLAPAAILGDRLMRNVLQRRFELVKLDAEAAWLTARRVPSVLRYRRANRTWNRERPGQRYFYDQRFDIDSPPQT